MIGADAVRDVSRWKEPEESFRFATLLVVHRAGKPAVELGSIARLSASENQPVLIEMPAVDVSSTEIRRRVAAGESIDGMVPASVAHFIAEHGVYR
jgi:nicotinate-nucleotide adenylyltransferase